MNSERQQIEAVLAEVYAPTGVAIWMSGRHKLLGGERPIELIGRGEAKRVLAIATQLAESAYA